MRHTKTTAEFLELEPRLLCHGDDHHLIGSERYWPGGSRASAHRIHHRHAMHVRHLRHVHGGRPRVPAGPPPAPGSPLSSIPALDSNPGAPATIYVDFDGNPAQSWGSYNVPITPAYDTDGDTASFSASELTNIQQIWARVAEAYSPFNLNVTTVDPGALVDGQSVKVVVGGAGAWLGSAAGGVSYIGSFANSAPNVAWAFTANLGNGNPKYTADASIHELGHALGLIHQSAYVGTKKTAEYRGGTALVAPFMGVSYYATRGKWSNGQSSASYASLQDDMNVVAGSANGFGYRTDDHGDTIGTADALDVNGDTVTGSGLIGRTTDVDAFSFVTSAGPVSFTVSPATYGATLDATLKLVDTNGTVLASSDTAALGESVSTTVAEGAYRLIVSSKGVYGDVGTYTISGMIVPSPNYVAAPSNLTATATPTGVTLAWYDNPWNETGFTIERSDDGGTTWNPLGDVADDIQGYLDATAVVGQTYKYRVFAFNATDQSGNSNTATIAVTPAVPGSFAAASISSTRIDLSWADVTGETGYIIERSLNGTTWTALATPAADETTYSNTGLTAGTKYYYRIRAAGAVGNSANATAANATTRTAQPTLSLTVLSSTQIKLTWTNVLGETGYRVERSPDDSTWTTLTTTVANAITYTSAGLTAGTPYYYRVTAIDAGGDSVAGTANTTTLLTPPAGLAAAAVSTTEVDLSWTDSTGETGYKLERSLNQVTWTLVATLAADETSYDNTALAGGTTYYYRLRALNAGGMSTPGAVSNAVTIPLQPTLTVLAISPTQIRLTWLNVTGETGYRVERSDDGSTGWSTLTTAAVNATAYTDSGLTTDTPYYYRVTPFNAAGDGASTLVKQTSTLLTAPAGLTATTFSTTQINLAWTDSDTETAYVLERSLNNSTWTAINTPAADATSYSNTGLVAGTTYFYRLRAANAGGNSAPSTTTSTPTLPAAVSLTATAASPTQINLAWNNVAGETGYRVERSPDGSTWTTLATKSANAITHAVTGLTADTAYSFRVTAFNSAGDGASTTIARRTLLTAPTGFAVAPVSTTSLGLSWTNSAGNTGYRIERLNGTTWALVTTTAADVTSYTNTGLVRLRSYTYRLRALNAGGMSAPSATAAATTPASAPIVKK